MTTDNAKKELLSKIETFVNGVLDTLSQDKNSIVKRIDEELKDFIITVGYDCAEPREKRIIHLMDSLADVSVKSALRIIKLEKQLRKAKEILVKLLKEEKDNMYWEMNGSDKSSYCEVRTQAEQFLKELEND